jgi:hypothetical protein
MKIIISIVIFALTINLFSQVNLVPNFSFEEYSECPPWTYPPQIDVATGWSIYSVSNSTPDYYNVCAPSTEFGLPQNTYCYQHDNRNCGAYMGFLTVDATMNYREHIGAQLHEPLIIGQKYYISFYTVMGEYILVQDQYGMPSNNVCLRLSTIPYSNNNPAPIDNFAHLRAESIITDSVNWVRISGSIVADSAYSYIMMGNFYDDANTDTLHYSCPTCSNIGSYYLIDDICISTDSLLCNGGIELLPCILSLEENKHENQISISPNPTNDYVNISNKDNKLSFDIAIYNSVGQQLYSKENINISNLTVDVSKFAANVLFIKIGFNNQILNYKLLKQ